MVSFIANRYQKSTACCFLFIFYFQMVASALYHPSVRYSAVDDYSTLNLRNSLNASLLLKPGSVGINANTHEQPDLKRFDNHAENKRLDIKRSDAFDAGNNVPMGPGPSQPEMSSFKSVGADNMVDLFSGDLSYNIPLLDVGGYPISIHYNSGITMDQEASWVGLGWNINPGAITRSVRGLPDDFNGSDQIHKAQNVKPNKTVGGSYSKNFELLGKKIGSATLGLGLGMQAGIFYNNYKGWGMQYGVTPSMSTGLFSKGKLTAGLSFSNNSQTGLDISPSFGVSIEQKGKTSIGLDAKVSSNYNSRTGISALQMGLSGNSPNQTIRDIENNSNASLGHYPAAAISFAKPAFSPTISMPYTTESYTLALSFGRYKNFSFKSYGSLSGYSTKIYIAKEDTAQDLPAFGYLYYQKAKDAGSKVLMDFNRDKEVPFRDKTPHIGVLSYTYDLYSISGEGIGGSFRPYRGDIGFVFDHENSTKSKSSDLALDLGIGTGWAQFGADFDKTINKTITGQWANGNNNILAKEIAFRNEDSTVTEPVYFKNPGEIVKVDKNFIESIGDTDLVNVGLVGIGSNNSPNPVLNNSLNRYRNQQFYGTLPLRENSSYRKQRDKRTQVISYMTAEIAAKYAIDTLIRAYNLNAIPSLGCNTNYYTIKRNDGIRKPHHLSEISVLNNDGKRYVYGIPVYNSLQSEVSFAVNKLNGNNTTGLVTYTPGNENSLSNNVAGTDNFFSKESTPSFAHSFLLSSILSSDYVDITGNGLSEDDQGDAIKFNYSRIYGENTSYYKWRAPFVENSASYSEGLKSDKRDDRGSYTYGEKEIWYLNSLESKNMIATFKLETDPLKARKDVYGTKGENGRADANQKMYQLKEINLYAKADLIKYGITVAKPIKTVHFEYDYSLCKGHPGAESPATGKLTLPKIWFTYNKNEKGIINPYIFKYDKDVVDGNGNITGNNGPGYNNKSYDKWGNYKDPATNLGPSGDKLTNTDFPYSVNDSSIAATNAATWCLNEVQLPSRGKLKITYESDDYAYVQNKRSMQMMEVVGFSATPNGTPQNFLYEKGFPSIQSKSEYIFIKVPEVVNSNDELFVKYLEGISKVYVKFNLKVPTDVWGGGSELVPCYFDIDQYGIADAVNKIIWIKPKYFDNKNPFLLAATQFIRMNLYSKAYPNSEPGDDISLRSFIAAVGSVFENIANAKAGFYNYTLAGGRCKEVISNKSFIRLDNPSYKRYGGGHRVKKIEIFDSWDKMTTTQQESKYGKEYTYTTTIKDLNGSDKLISSGVASYEPMVGKDENPFTIPSDPYKEQVGLLAPTDYFYVDEPIMESFYPSASVGYSKVRVTSIHKIYKSGKGSEETEFFTTKDFPTRSAYTPLIEGESKFTDRNPAPKKLSFFNFDAKSYVSLSQGFKIELNDMNGKIKRTATYAQNDPTKEISYTKNYYRLENDRTENRLSNKVDVIDSADGIINSQAEMGKEVELMVDLREQLSVTSNSSKQLNLLIQKVNFIPGFLPIPIPLWYNKSEINRYRSAAVTKVVTQHGILDSVIVMDKGSKVTTKNLVYDSETGEVVLTRTNNEFDDAIYNFNYPAHWAYSGMGSAYKNIQKRLTGQNILYGTLKNRDNERFFESGDEIILTEKEPKKSIIGAVITGFYTTKTRKVWAIDASKGQENHKGMYFIDANGNPVSTPNNELTTMVIIRSGKRNMLSAGAGNITSIANPIRLVSTVNRIVFDTGSHVIAASAGVYKDFWRVDSTVSPVDTCYKVLDSATVYLPLTEALLVKKFNKHGKDTDLPSEYDPLNIYSGLQHRKRGGTKKGHTNAMSTSTILNFDFKKIPKNATILSAKLSMTSMPYRGGTFTVSGAFPGYWDYTAVDPSGAPNSNIAAHYNKVSTSTGSGNGINLKIVTGEWHSNTGYSSVLSQPSASIGTIKIPSTTGQSSCDNINNLECQSLVQEIINSEKNTYGIQMDLLSYSVNGNSTREDERRSRSYYSGFGSPAISDNSCVGNIDTPMLVVKYKYMKDTCSLSCQPSIRPENINPYKFGVLGNWRMNRAYTYYDMRKESDASLETNIRRDGEISGFLPYWAFNSVGLSRESADTMVRWVWNSELTKFNRKGLEIENMDPLNRFNSGQYGYNKSLPIAVVQNSKSRNSVFDGFEDYDYKTSYCEAECLTSQCLPPTYDNALKNVDTLQNAINGYLSNLSRACSTTMRSCYI